MFSAKKSQVEGNTCGVVLKKESKNALKLSSLPVRTNACMPLETHPNL
jgi:hypothetical protein